MPAPLGHSPGSAAAGTEPACRLRFSRVRAGPAQLQPGADFGRPDLTEVLLRERLPGRAPGPRMRLAVTHSKSRAGH
jgi:hypothetical protein